MLPLSSQTRRVLDADGQKGRFNVMNTHKPYRSTRHVSPQRLALASSTSLCTLVSASRAVRPMHYEVFDECNLHTYVIYTAALNSTAHKV